MGHDDNCSLPPKEVNQQLEERVNGERLRKTPSALDLSRSESRLVPRKCRGSGPGTEPPSATRYWSMMKPHILAP